MQTRWVECGPVTLPSDITFALKLSPFGGPIPFVGSQNWFELLRAANVCSVRENSQPGYNRIDRIKRCPSSRTCDDVKFTEPKAIKKETSPKTKLESLPRPLKLVKPRVPVINILRASNESIPDLYNMYYISESSDEESDYDDDEDLVYECPGLADSTEDTTVKNPLFQQKHFEISYRTPEDIGSIKCKVKNLL